MRYEDIKDMWDEVQINAGARHLDAYYSGKEFDIDRYIVDTFGSWVNAIDKTSSCMIPNLEDHEPEWAK